MSIESWDDSPDLSTRLSEIKLSKSDDDSNLKHDKMAYSFRSSFFFVSITFSCLISHHFKKFDLKKSPFLLQLFTKLTYSQTERKNTKIVKSLLALRRISCHGRNYSQPYFFKRNQSSDNRSHGFGAKFLLKKLSASDFSYERKSAFTEPFAMGGERTMCKTFNIYVGRTIRSI